MACFNHLGQIDFIRRFFVFFHVCLWIPSNLIWFCLLGDCAYRRKSSHIQHKFPKIIFNNITNSLLKILLQFYIYFYIYLDLMENSPLETLEALQQRVTAKEQANLQTFQKQILQELKNLRETLLAQSHASNAVASATSDEKKDKRILQLQTQNKRLEYRIVHLTRNLKQALQKQ